MEGVEKIKKFVRDERTLKVLETIFKAGAITILAIGAPAAAGHIIKLLGWVPDYKTNYRTKRLLGSLERRKFIRFYRKNGRGKIELTPEGRLHFANLKARSIKLPHMTRWDGVWRVITYDIPEKIKKNRQRFTRTIESLGMCNLEKSIYVYPHECKDQIFKIAKLYEIDKYVRYMEVINIEPDFKLQVFFPQTKN